MYSLQELHCLKPPRLPQYLCLPLPFDEPPDPNSATGVDGAGAPMAALLATSALASLTGVDGAAAPMAAPMERPGGCGGNPGGSVAFATIGFATTGAGCWSGTGGKDGGAGGKAPN